jgi:hypothetical protein
MDNGFKSVVILVLAGILATVFEIYRDTRDTVHFLKSSYMVTIAPSAAITIAAHCKNTGGCDLRKSSKSSRNDSSPSFVLFVDSAISVSR